jgi:hypothetical protein
LLSASSSWFWVPRATSQSSRMPMLFDLLVKQ